MVINAIKKQNQSKFKRGNQKVGVGELKRIYFI